MNKRRCFFCILLIGMTLSSDPGQANSLSQQVKAFRDEARPVELSDGSCHVSLYYLHIRNTNPPQIELLINNKRLTRYDGYKIIFLPSSSCYLTIFRQEYGKRVVRVFPQYDEPVGRKQYNLPALGETFDVGDPPQLHDLYVVASAHSLQALHTQYDKMSATSDEFQRERHRSILLDDIAEASRSGKGSHIHLNTSDVMGERVAASAHTQRTFDEWLDLVSKSAAANRITLFRLFYDRSAELTPEARQILQGYRSALHTRSKVHLAFLIHTDQSQQQWGADRTTALRRFMTQQGARQTHIEFVNMGTQEPLASATDPEAPYVNNRLEIIHQP